jgi:plasmid stability protein
MALLWRATTMPSIQVKNVPPDVHRILRTRAAAAGMSLQEYLLAELTERARQPTLREIFDRIEREETEGSVELDEVVRIIRKDRDSR